MIQKCRDYETLGRPIEGGSELYRMFRKLSQEALWITAKKTENKVIKKTKEWPCFFFDV